MKKILYIDMDGVLANFIDSFRKKYDSNTNKFPQSNWGFFANLEPMDKAIETVKNLMEYYDVWILTRPSYMNPLCYTEKRIWIEKYFGLEFCKKLIICSNKSLLKGDYLIDDYLEHGQSEFEGELLHFGVNNSFKGWDEVYRYLIDYKINGNIYKSDITLEFEAIERRESEDLDYAYRLEQIKEYENYEEYVKREFGPAPEENGWYCDDNE